MPNWSVTIKAGSRVLNGAHRSDLLAFNDFDRAADLDAYIVHVPRYTVLRLSLKFIVTAQDPRPFTNHSVVRLRQGQ